MLGRELNGNYHILELVGSGGFADVYLGRDVRSNTVVAIKVLHSHFARDPQLVQRFLQEAHIAQTLQEPHIVRVLDAGEDAGTYYIVMEYVQGHTLAHILSTRGALPIPEAVVYTRQILLALEAAHRADIVHRDIKPQNIMVTPDGTVKVMDFGIAKHAAAGKMTQTGMYLGTPQYMSPEQAKGEKVDARSDLYSTAIVLYEMLGGRPPFDAESPWSVLSQQVTNEPPPIGGLRSDVPAQLVQTLTCGLEKVPTQRFQTAAEMLAGLGAQGFQLGQPLPLPAAARAAVAVRGRTGVPLWLARGRHSRLLPAGVAGVLLVSIAIAMALSLGGRQPGALTPTPTDIVGTPDGTTGVSGAAGPSIPTMPAPTPTPPAPPPSATPTRTVTPIPTRTAAPLPPSPTARPVQIPGPVTGGAVRVPGPATSGATLPSGPPATIRVFFSIRNNLPWGYIIDRYGSRREASTTSGSSAYLVTGPTKPGDRIILETDAPRFALMLDCGTSPSNYTPCDFVAESSQTLPREIRVNSSGWAALHISLGGNWDGFRESHYPQRYPGNPKLTVGFYE